MLAHPNQIPQNYSLYQNKLIRIISPFSGEQFKIELGGKENEFRELLATLLNIDSSYIKGLKDSYGNYYTLSSALNGLFIFSNENNLFSLVLNIPNNNKYKQYSEAYDRNMLYNVNNNYHNRTEYNKIYIGHSNKKLMKSKSHYRYTNLIKELIPAINRNFRDEEEYEKESYYTLERHPKYAKILKNIKEKFSKEQYNVLKELLKMENITIINYFKLYEKSNDKKDLIKNLKSLYKKYHKKISKNDSTISEEESSQDKSHKRNKKYIKDKRISRNSDITSITEIGTKSHKSHFHHKKREKSQSSSSESESNKSSQSKSKSKSKSSSDSISEKSKDSESENSEETIIDKNIFPIKCSSLEDVIDNLKQIFNNQLIINCLFTNDIDYLKKTETQKSQLLENEFGIKNFIITENIYETIKTYYENIMKKNIEKDMTENEKSILYKLIKKKNRSIHLRFIALFRHNNYSNLSNDLKECIKDYLKRKKGSEHKVHIKHKESRSLNSNSNDSEENDNDNQDEIGMDDSIQSIRKNERMAKNKQKKNNEQKSQKSNDDNSIGQFKLMEMNDESKSGENSKKSEGFSRKSSSKIANEKDDDKKNANFIPKIRKFKDEGNLNITDNELNIIINEFNSKNQLLLSIIEECEVIEDQDEQRDELIEGIEGFLKNVYKKKLYVQGEPVKLIGGNNNENNNKKNNDNNENKNITPMEQPYEKEIIAGLKGEKFSKKGNKKIMNILLKNNIYTKDQMEIIDEDLEQDNNYIIGSFEVFYLTKNVKELVENLNLKLKYSQTEKENQIKNNLDIIMKSFNEKQQNKIKELYDSKDNNLMNILRTEINDIQKAKEGITNLLENN